jgi:hypothetical protein
MGMETIAHAMNGQDLMLLANKGDARALRPT